jgi:putative polyketide hydroxylase
VPTTSLHIAVSSTPAIPASRHPELALAMMRQGRRHVILYREEGSYAVIAQEHVPVLIVGAGGAGLSLSLLLRQQGIASVVLEQRSDVSWYPRARNLNFRTLEVFRGLGLEARVIAVGSHVSRMFRKETLASAEQEEFPAIDEATRIVDHPEILTPEPPTWYCPQSRLEPLLVAAAKDYGGDVRYNTELVSFTQDTQGVTATIRERATGRSSVLRTDYLAACDGAHSHIREVLDVKTEGLGELDEHYTFIYFRANWSELIRGYEADAILIDRPDLRGFFLITDKNHGMLLLQDAPSQRKFAQDYTAERCKELVLKGIGKPDLAVEIVDIAHWQPAQLVAEHFQHGRVLLVGDAAHTMPPKLGLGVNTAIQSAQNLAWKLAAVLNGNSSPELLTTYETERRPVGRLASEQSLVGPAASVLTQGSDDQLLPEAKRISLFSLIAGYRYRSQAILDEDADPASPAQTDLLEKPEQLTGLPGSRVPHFWVERHGQRISTLDLVDGRFVLLAGPAGTAWQQAALAAAASLEIELVACRLGTDGDLLDPEDGWRAKLAMSTQGAVLIRPDGFVAWRTSTLPTNPKRRLEQVLSSILCRPREPDLEDDDSGRRSETEAVKIGSRV